MEKLRELSFEEMQEVDGGAIMSQFLWADTVCDFMIGVSETYMDALRRYSQKIKYQK